MNDSDLEYPHTLSYKKLNSLKSKVQSGFLTPSILRKLADEMDEDGSGDINFAEFLKWYSGGGEEDRVDKPGDVFFRQSD